jgi:phosphoribosylformimino-5-aminoimidazole carboxamide ribotide isomerase
MWQAQGAKLIHIVDLDGAIKGKPQNSKAIYKIRDSVSVALEVGGGIRSLKTINQFLNKGIERIILGTKALEDEEFFKEALKYFKEKVILALDVKGQDLALSGWRRLKRINIIEFLKELKYQGVKRLIYTDVQRDGTLKGPDIKKLIFLMQASKINFIFSGGISSLEDLRRLKALKDRGLEGIIIGKALYERRFSLQEALRV